MSGGMPGLSGEGPKNIFGLAAIWEERRNVRYYSGQAQVLQLFWAAVRSLLRSPLTTLVTVLSITVALLLLSLFLLTSRNLNTLLAAGSPRPELSIFLDDRAPPERVQALQDELLKIPEVAAVKFRDKAAALAEFRETLGRDRDLLEGLDQDNPLPASLIVALREEHTQPEVYAKIDHMYEGHPLIERIQYEQGLITQVQTLLVKIKKAGWVALFLLLLITAAIIANTITLALYSRKDEVYIMRLVGASPSFVLAPCLIEGLLQGLIGSLAALGITAGISTWFRSFLAQHRELQEVVSGFAFLPWWSILLLICCGAGIGALGSFYAAKSFGGSE